MILRKLFKTLVCSVTIAVGLLTGAATFANSASPPDPVFTLDAAEVRRAEAGARQGNIHDMALIGMTYVMGDGSVLPKDPSKGAQWMLRSAQLGNVEAQLALAMFYDRGDGVAVDGEEATRWYRKVADADASIRTAFWFLSMHLLKGHGAEREPGEAVRLAMEAADEAEPVTASIAMHLLGKAYLRGVRAPLDPAEGIRWLRRAAGHGEVNSMEELGNRYLQGTDVPRNEIVGVEWLRLAAGRGHVSAMRSLTTILEEGRGKVRPNPEEAAMWRRKAVELGGESAASCGCAQPAG